MKKQMHNICVMLDKEILMYQKRKQILNLYIYSLFTYISNLTYRYQIFLLVKHLINLLEQVH